MSLPLRNLRDIVAVIFDKVPDLQEVLIDSDFTDHNDENSLDPETSVSFKGVPDPVLDAIPEVRRLERECRQSCLPCDVIDHEWNQWSGQIKFTRGEIELGWTQVDSYDGGLNYFETLDFNTLAIIKVDADELKETLEENPDDEAAKYLLDEVNLPVDAIGQQSAFVQAA